jgi:hypothetical protein
MRLAAYAFLYSRPEFSEIENLVVSFRNLKICPSGNIGEFRPYESWWLIGLKKIYQIMYSWN